jgi:membrane protease subunit HflC
MYKQIKTTGLIAAVLILIFWSFTFVVNEGQYAVITQFGKPLTPVTSPGLKFKLPYPVHRVNYFDARKQLFTSRLVEFLTKDKKNVLIKCYVSYQIDNPLVFLQAVGNSAIAQQKLDDLLIAKGGATVGDFDFSELLSVDTPVRINDLEAKILSDIKTVAKTDYGLEILDVGISRLALPQANAQSVYNRMREERKAMANKYRAEGDEEAQKIQADAEKEKSNILAAAEKQSLITMGEGDSEAAKIYADAFSQDAEFYQFWRTLEAYNKILDSQTTLVLTEDSELFKYLKR